MRRRNLIFGLLAIATTRGAHAQQTTKAPRIAVVDPAKYSWTESTDAFASAFFNELRRLGYVEGDNLLIERYSGEGRAPHYPDLARDVVRRNPDVIVALTTELTLDFKAATTTIPIVGVFATPLEAGIVSSLARPGGNVTGASVDAAGDLWLKRLELFHEMVPQAIRLGYLTRREIREAWEALGRPGDEVARKMGVSLIAASLDNPIDEAEYRRVFVGLIQDHADGFMVHDDFENVDNRKLIVELTKKNRLPAAYPYKLFVEAGGLMSYGADVAEFGHRAAAMAALILKGAKPAEIPIFQPTKFELVINLKTAKVLGNTVPPELLARADEVIE
jgi:putative ABC transport system substrate-binding protein